MHLLRWLAGRWATDADEQRAGQLSATPGLPPPGRDVAVEVMKLAGVSVGDWPLRWQCALAVEDAEAGLSALAAHLGVCVARSRLAGGTAGRGVFALRRFKSRETIDTFWGAIAYVDLNQKTSKTARYAVSVLGAQGPTAKQFTERALQVELTDTASASDDGAVGRPKQRRKRARARGGGKSSGRSASSAMSAHGDGGRTVLWIVPSPMCVMGYINDGRATSAIDEEVDRAAAAAAADCVERSGCGDGDCSAGERRGAHGAGREANVAIVVDHDDKGGTLLPTPMDFVSPAKVVVEAVRRIEVGEELLTDDGSEYMFSGPEWRRSGRGRGGVLLSRSTPHTFAPVCE